MAKARVHHRMKTIAIGKNYRRRTTKRIVRVLGVARGIVVVEVIRDSRGRPSQGTAHLAERSFQRLYRPTSIG